MDLKLAGKRAIVTGGSRGIGRAIARSLLDEGVKVVIVARDADALRRVAEDLAAQTGGEVHGIAADTRDDASVDALVEQAVAVMGGIDILVNAAARAWTTSVPGLGDTTSDYALEEINTKVIGYLRTARAVAPRLVVDGWGRIINISGLAARQAAGIVGSICNVGVSALTKNLADELGPKGINVTVVHPGATRTERTAETIAARAVELGISEKEAEQRLHGGSLIGRIVEAEEIADIVTFLASPRSVAINGDAIAAGDGTPKVIHY